MRVVDRTVLWMSLIALVACSGATDDVPGNGANGAGSLNFRPDASVAVTGGSMGGNSGGGSGADGASNNSGGSNNNAGTSNGGNNASTGGGNSGSGGTTTGGSGGAGSSSGGVGGSSAAGSSGAAGQGGSSQGPRDSGVPIVDAAQEPAPVYMNAVSDPKKCWTDPEQHKGGLTYYAETPLGNCGEPWPADGMYAAMNTVDYGQSNVCGTCVEITGPTGIKGIVHVVDQCPIATNPKCFKGHIDLSQKAFRTVKPDGDGVVYNPPGVAWRYVSCNVTGPITYHFEPKTQQYWVGVQVRNSKYAIKNIEYRAADGTWKSLAPRTVDLAYFVLDKPPSTMLDFRVTDINGQTVEDVGVKPAANADVKGHAQFPTCTP